MPQENDLLNDRLDKISEEISFLSKKVSSLEQRMDEDAKDGAIKASAYFESVPVSSPAATDNQDYFSGGEDSILKTEKESEDKVSKEEGFEAEIGLKWLGRIGIFALVLGVAFFLKYAFENDWIGESGRVAIGLFFGIVLIYLGDHFRTKFREYAATLTGGGIAVLYLSVYSSFAYYELIDRFPAFIAMAIITALGAILAIYYERISLALLSILGGFLTPFLLPSGSNNQIELFGYLTILNLGIVGISHYCDWRKLNSYSFIATVLIFLVWRVQFYDNSQLFSTESFLTIWFMIYVAAIVSHNIIQKKKSDFYDLVFVFLSAVIYFVISYNLLDADYGDYMGFFAILMAAIYSVLFYLHYRANAEDGPLSAALSGVSILFLSLAVLIQFNGIWITIAWALEAVALVGIGFYLKNVAIRYFAWILSLLVVLRLIDIGSYGQGLVTDYTLILNERFLTSLVGVVVFAMIYRIYAQHRESIKFAEIKAIPIALFLMNFLLLWNLSAEAVCYFEYKIETQSVREIYPVCEYETDFRGRRVESPGCSQAYEEYYSAQASNTEMVKKVQGTRNTVLTILWAFYAIILLAFGMLRANRFLRLMGIGLLGIVIAKLFLVDLWNMGGIYRIISSATLGVILLSASFAYNKYKEKIKEII
ncbi:MAG: DUF2339 domain-containing protein [Candidatus Pacebacteria bacterium]|nr:DUF2339 domain-containing protein [Candidatus Paceibacterota bacterium]